MKIEKTYSRKTKKNHYRSYFADNGRVLWYVALNKREITRVVKRSYSNLKEEIYTEKSVQISELPQSIFNFIVNDLDNKK